MLLQLISSCAEHRKLVVHIVFMSQAQWQGDERIRYMVVVEIGETLTLGIVCIKITEFYVEDGGVHFRHSAVDARIVKLVFHMASIVGKCAYGIGKRIVAGCHRSRVAHSPNVLARIEAVGSCLS